MVVLTKDKSPSSGGDSGTQVLSILWLYHLQHVDSRVISETEKVKETVHRKDRGVEVTVTAS